MVSYRIMRRMMMIRMALFRISAYIQRNQLFFKNRPHILLQKLGQIPSSRTRGLKRTTAGPMMPVSTGRHAPDPHGVSGGDGASVSGSIACKERAESGNVYLQSDQVTFLTTRRSNILKDGSGFDVNFLGRPWKLCARLSRKHQAFSRIT